VREDDSRKVEDDPELLDLLKKWFGFSGVKISR
jgi:hypothetical protein